MVGIRVWMAMEQQENHRDGEQGGVMIDQGWGDLSPASPSRFYSTSCWRPWGEAAEMFSSAGDFSQCAESVGDGWDTFDGADAELSEPACDAETDRKCAGLMNLGNTCFLNAVLQCLTYTVPFANRVMRGQHKTSCHIKDFCAMCALEDHIKVVFSALGRTVSPAYLADNLIQISKSFVPGQQQDAHECFFILIEVLQKCCTSDSGSASNLSGDNSFVSDIFIGQIRSQVKCNSCLHSSDSVEAFLGLSLEVENCYSVNEALSNFMAVEVLEEESEVSCSQCNVVASRSKQMSFDKSPQVLAIHLKRFKASAIFPTKIDRDVKYGLSLDLMPFISKSDSTDQVQEGDWKYRLYAVLVHSGWSTTSGHYYCYVQTSPGTWHCMNDTLVSRVSERTVLHQEAYILFYIREGIEEVLHPEVALPAEPHSRSSESHVMRLQTSETLDDRYLCPSVDDPYLCPSLAKDNVASNASSLPVEIEVEDAMAPSQPTLMKLSDASKQVPVEIEVEDPIICSQPVERKTPGVLKRVSADRHSSMTLPTQGASKISLPSSKEGMSSDEHEKPKHFHSVKGDSSSKIERTQSPSPFDGRTGTIPNSFENGSQHSFMRVLNTMPSGRRQALLASALSGQEAVKHSSPTTNRNTNKSRPASAIKQKHFFRDGTGETTSISQKSEEKTYGKLISREKEWTEGYSSIGSRKLQRVGGKRVIASFMDSGVYHQKVHGGVAEPAKANV